MKKEVRGRVSLVLASAMLVTSPMAAGMTETVQAEELTVDSKVAQIQGESIIPSGSSSRKRGVVCSVCRTDILR